MSNRSLIEINHDKVHAIEADHEGFVRALIDYLNSGSRRDADPMKDFGATVFGMRHHSDPFHIEWGGHTIDER